MGKYTAEEFEKAFGQFSETRKPFIFTYFKPPTVIDQDGLQSLWAFEKKLKELKHYKTKYETIEGLREHFGNQLDKLAVNGFLRLKPEDSTQEKSEKPPGSTENTATVSGTGNKVYQDVNNSTINDSSKSYNTDNIDSVT